MAQGHNGGPPLVELNSDAFRSWVRSILNRTDLSSTQKVLAVSIAVEANPEWEAEMRNGDLARMVSIRKRETLYAATQVLIDKGIISKDTRNGYANSYRILPPYVIESVIAEYKARATPTPNRAPHPSPETDTPPVRLPDTPCPVDGHPPCPTDGQTTLPEMVTFPASPAYSIITSLTNLVDRPVSEELTPLPPKRAKRRPPEAAADRHDVFKAYEAWNDLALRCGLPQATTLTPKRIASIGARLSECGGLGAWETALANIEKSAFLCGETDRDFRASLDFLVQPSSFVKVLEGTYGNGRHRENKPKRTMVDVSTALAARFRNGGA
jgi:hypothetical protein